MSYARPEVLSAIPQMRGEKWRATHRATVESILGKETPPVVSKGSRFYNVDRWTLRVLVKHMCDWARSNPKAMPVRETVRGWVEAANREPTPARQIVIASTPEKISTRIAFALVGGASHEALHTRYSARRALTTEEMATLILPRWAQVPDWSKLYSALQEWNNLIEDIRIERCGNAEYPGIYQNMCELQDFILAQEEESVQAALKSPSGQKQLKAAMPVISATFRDKGLGYPTFMQEAAYEKYASRNKDAYEFVVKGPLSPLVKDAIHLSPMDDLGCLRLAMDVLIQVQKLVDPSEMEDKNGEGQGGGENMKPQCPKCGAPGKSLVVRPLSNGSGGIVRGKGVITCTKCGWQEIIDLKASSGSGGGSSSGGGAGSGSGGGQGGSKSNEKSDPDDAVQFDPTPQEVDSSSTEEGEEGDGEPSEGGSKSSKGKGKEEGEEGGAGPGDEDSEEDGGSGSGGGKGKGNEQDEHSDDEGSGSGSGSSAEGGEEGADPSDDTAPNGHGSPGDEDGSDDSDNDEGSGGGSGSGSEDSSGDESGSGAGGYHWDAGPAQGWDVIAQAALSEMESGMSNGLKDMSSALEAAFGEIRNKESKDCKKNEKPWRPYNYAADTFAFVTPSHQGIDNDRTRARQLVESVQSECAYLRARLRSIVRAMEQRSTYHGTPKGRSLSERMLVDSMLSIRGGSAPKRAFYRVSEKVDTSIAAVVVIDESGSMATPEKLQDATRCLIALTEPLDFLGASVLVAGFRDGYSPMGTEDYVGIREGEYHRTHAVHMDIFKSFNERFATVSWRFANTRGDGGTPMSDGIQFGLDVLNNRPEGHRILFIVTDGDPNHGHTPVIHRQIRLAREAGMVVIGVGIGNDCKKVMTLFPDHVWSKRVEEMPTQIIQKLNEILDFRGTSRGKKMSQD